MSQDQITNAISFREPLERSDGRHVGFLTAQITYCPPGAKRDDWHKLSYAEYRRDGETEAAHKERLVNGLLAAMKDAWLQSEATREES